METIETSKDIICSRCKLVITEKENYISLKEYSNASIIKRMFFHKKCWEDLNTPKKLALGLVAKANRLLNKLGGVEN